MIPPSKTLNWYLLSIYHTPELSLIVHKKFKTWPQASTGMRLGRKHTSYPVSFLLLQNFVPSWGPCAQFPGPCHHPHPVAQHVFYPRSSWDTEDSKPQDGAGKGTLAVDTGALGGGVWLGGRGRTGPVGRPHQLGTEPGSPAVSGSWSSPDAEVGREECWALTGVWAGSIGEMCPLEKGPPSSHAWEQGESQTWGACRRGERDPRLTWKAARVGNKAKSSGKNCEPWEHPTSVRDKNRNCEIGAS